MRPHVRYEHLARGLLVAVDHEVAAIRMAVADDPESGARKRDVLRAEERNPAEEEAQARNSRRSRTGAGSHPGTGRSSSGRFLCLGFFREDFGSSSLAAGTVPTRSRAIAFTSFADFKCFFLARQSSSAACLPSISAVNGFCRNMTRPGSGRFQTRSCPQDNRWRRSPIADGLAAEHPQSEFFHTHAGHGGVQHRDGEFARRGSIAAQACSVLSEPWSRANPRRPRYRPIIFSSWRFVVDDQNLSARAHKWQLYDRPVCDSIRNISRFKTKKHREFINITPTGRIGAAQERHPGRHDPGLRHAHHRRSLGQ